MIKHPKRFISTNRDLPASHKCNATHSNYPTSPHLYSFLIKMLVVFIAATLSEPILG
ncbi:hypothetical protein EX30DRAFT_341192 [Ascodesmis nigricans]|uniref:Uncharacterized protein n=1 Tax=Ascodesmis nigricans TaxID=341454 RepID=A0A4S2MWD3_9PEZI|nr:hypothetical protein EX30DRAFT_341192 [Ascodesmis nigricans]